MDAEQLQRQNKELRILNAIAHHLNQAVELRAALQASLQHTVELLNLHTGWIWLVHSPTQSVYLAASHQLPPVFQQHPERLSGWCWCIEKYLSDRMDTTVNISEITCSRLKDIEQGTAGLRYHASVPLFSGAEKIGIMNVVSAESQQLTETKLQTLHTIGDLLSMAITRAQAYEQSKARGAAEERQRFSRGLGEQLLPTLDRLLIKLQAAQLPGEEMSSRDDQSLQKSEALANRLLTAILEMQDTLKEMAETATLPTKEIKYPGPPLSPREREVLHQLQLGKTNKQIADELFISERTVKFHVSAILQKLDATNRTEAVRMALERGMITVS